MNPIVAGVIAGICSLIIMIINLVKGAGLFGIIVNPIFSGVLIFGIIIAVQFVLSKFIGIDFDEKTSYDKTATGENVDFTVSDDVVDTNKYDESDLSVDEGAADTSADSNLNADSFVETNFGTIENVDDYETGSGMDNLGSDNYADDNIANSSVIGGFDDGKREAKVSKALGFDASYEDMAKAIRTTLKRDNQD